MRLVTFAVSFISLLVFLCQAVFNVTKAQYPIPMEDIHTLAGLQASVFATENHLKADVATLSPFMDHFYPPSKTKLDPTKAISRLLKPSSSSGSLGQSFAAALQSAQSKITDHKVLYLQLCWSKPYYGYVCTCSWPVCAYIRF